MLNEILAGACAYVLGSIPWGLWIGHLWGGIDVREYGSKNTGATNIYRVLGMKAALLVFLLDAGKGALGVWLGMWLTGEPSGALIGGLGAIIGHNWSFIMKFKGGRGVATGVGVLAMLMPPVAAAAFICWGIAVALTRYVSLGSVLGAGIAPIFAWYLGYPSSYQVVVLLASLFVIFRHRENIIRLFQGTESKVGRIAADKEEPK